MKKLCLLLVTVCFISVMPASAMKIIVNDQNDRVVYSRSSKYDTSVPDESTYTNKGYGKVNYSSEEYAAAKNYKPQEIDYYQLKILSNDIKRDLVGTTWQYNNDDNYYNEDNTEIQKTSYNEFEDYAKRNSREAADYYTKDLANNPDELIPSGFDY